MPSWQAGLLSFVLRQTFKRRLAAAGNDIAAIRAVFDRGSRRPAPAGLKISQTTIAGVPGEWVTPPEPTESSRVLLFLHGGGYIACSSKTHRTCSTFFARRGFCVFMPDYRLAPEHPFPAGLNDAVAGYRGLRSMYPSSKIVMAGDSAGGGLALAAMLMLREEGCPLPLATALFSPLTDLTGSGQSRISQSRISNDKRCAMFHCKGLDLLPPLYAPGGDWRQPLISPLFGDYTGFPPLLIHWSEDETLRDDAAGLVTRARQCGVSVEARQWSVVPHDWQMAHRFVPEGRASLEQAAAFLMR